MIDVAKKIWVDDIGMITKITFQVVWCFIQRG